MWMLFCQTPARVMSRSRLHPDNVTTDSIKESQDAIRHIAHIFLGIALIALDHQIMYRQILCIFAWFIVLEREHPLDLTDNTPLDHVIVEDIPILYQQEQSEGYIITCFIQRLAANSDVRMILQPFIEIVVIRYSLLHHAIHIAGKHDVPVSYTHLR